jgi:lysophospholipase L1-like esterase
MRLRPPNLATAAIVAALLAISLTAAGCDNGPKGATVGNPSGTGTPTAGTTTTYPSYVALGDSYTAAPGVPTTEQEDGCLRSDGNYPSLLASRLPGTRFVDVSCSGASTRSLTGEQRNADHAYPPQFNALQPDTSLVTIGMGGNDLELFNTLISVCAQLGLGDPQHAPCRDYMLANGPHGKDLLVSKIDRIQARVTSSLKQIHDRAHDAKVVLVGYPQLVPAKGRCKILPLAKGDYPYVRSILVKLDGAMRAAATKGGATYVDVLRASKGHDICAGKDAWVDGIATDVNRALAFHPFPEEQQAVADLIAQALQLG